MDSRITLELNASQDATLEELAIETRDLRREILQLPIVEVPATSIPTAPGAKGADAASVTTLVLGAIPAVQILRSIVSIANARLARDSVRSITLKVDGDELEVAGVSSADQAALIAAWIERNARDNDD